GGAGASFVGLCRTQSFSGWPSQSGLSADWPRPAARPRAARTGSRRERVLSTAGLLGAGRRGGGGGGGASGGAFGGGGGGSGVQAVVRIAPAAGLLSLHTLGPTR